MIQWSMRAETVELISRYLCHLSKRRTPKLIISKTRRSGVGVKLACNLKLRSKMSELKNKIKPRRSRTR